MAGMAAMMLAPMLAPLVMKTLGLGGGIKGKEMM